MSAQFQVQAGLHLGKEKKATGTQWKNSVGYRNYLVCGGEENKIGNVRINVTLGRVRVTIVAV
jgi:hypothetical protein